MDAYFESCKNQSGGIEYPFYGNKITTGSRGYECAAHWHYHFEILYFNKGRGTVTIGSDAIEVNEGEIILITPCEIHSVIANAGELSEHIVMSFDPSLLNVMPKIDFVVKYFLQNLFLTNPKLRVLPFVMEIHEIDRLANLFTEEYWTRDIGFELMATSVIYQIMTMVLRGLEKKGLILLDSSTLVQNNLSKLIHLLQYVDLHYMDDMTALSAAEVCSMSYSHFAKLFKSAMHISFIQYLNHYRIRKSESLLLDGGKSITQIALEVGFNDTSYFIREFKSYKGMSPKKYLGLMTRATVCQIP